MTQSQWSLAASIIGFATAAMGFLRGRKSEKDADLRDQLKRLEKRLDRFEGVVLESQASTAKTLGEIFVALQAPKTGSGN